MMRTYSPLAASLVAAIAPEFTRAILEAAKRSGEKPSGDIWHGAAIETVLFARLIEGELTK